MLRGSDHESIRRLSRICFESETFFCNFIDHVRPRLHHYSMLRQISSPIIGGTDLIALLVSQLTFDNIGSNSSFVQHGRCNRAERVP